jgi:outer membrane protein, multidrug efflux system
MTPRSAACLTGLLAFAGCTAVGPNYEKPAEPAPPAFKHAGPTLGDASASPAGSQNPTSPVQNLPTWSVFADSTLEELQAAALAHNHQLAAAVARIDEARARLGFARADRSPTLSTQATARLAGETAGRTLPTPAGPITYRERGDSYRVPFDAAYEIDLWGRVRRQVEAAGAQIEASEQDVAFLRLSLAAEVAQAWFTLRALDAELAVVDATRLLRADQLGLTESRFSAGLSNQLDVTRTQLELANLDADLADLRRRREQTVNALAVLTGRTPADFAVNLERSPSAPAPAIPPGLPAELLARRPDVIAAERQLAARTAEIGVARAAFFPTLRLTGSAGFESADLGRLLNHSSQFWQLGPSVSFNVLDGGRNRANLAAAEACARAAHAEYRQKILVAFREVEDALVDLRQQSEQAAALDRAVVAARDTVGLATTRFDRGLIAYFEVLDARRALLATERAATQLAGARQISTVRLIKALGGGW